MRHCVHVQKELTEQARAFAQARAEAERPVRPGQRQEPASLLLSLLLLLPYQGMYSSSAQINHILISKNVCLIFHIYEIRKNRKNTNII